MKPSEHRALLGIAVLVIIVVGGYVYLTTALALNQPKNPYNPNPTVSAGMAWCSNVNSLYPLTQATPSIGVNAGCYSLPLTLTITTIDQYAAGAALSWTCKPISAGGPTNSLPAGASYETITGSSGVCTGTSTYQTGQALYGEYCSNGSCTYSNTNVVWEAPIACPNGCNGNGAGVVSFGSTSTQTALKVTQPLTQIGTFAITARVDNGTSLTSPQTVKNAWAQGPFGDGSGVKKGSITYQITNTKTGTAPFGFGYQTFQAYDQLPTVKSLTASFVQEIKANTGTDMVAITSGLNFLANKGSNDQVYYTGVPDASLTKVVNPDGSTRQTGTYTFAVAYDTSAISGTDSDGALISLLVYFFPSYYQTTGTTNTEAGSGAIGTVGIATFSVTFTA